MIGISGCTHLVVVLGLLVACKARDSRCQGLPLVLRVEAIAADVVQLAAHGNNLKQTSA